MNRLGTAGRELESWRGHNGGVCAEAERAEREASGFMDFWLGARNRWAWSAQAALR
jgi:hypothetical protein